MTSEEFKSLKVGDIIICTEPEIRGPGSSPWCPIGTKFQYKGNKSFITLSRFYMHGQEEDLHLQLIGSTYYFSGEKNEIQCYELIISSPRVVDLPISFNRIRNLGL